MQHLTNIFRIPVIILIATLFSCSKKEQNINIISKKELTFIVRDMYLADQYLESHEKLRAKTDTLILYEGIFNKYGYTFDDYKNSIRVYLQDGDALYKVHLKAKELMINERERVKELIAIENGNIVDWWALDTLRKKEVVNLWKEPFLRSVRWLTMQKEPIEWSFFTDTTLFDVPMNSIWWENNITLNIPGNRDTLYPTLLRDYMLAQERSKMLKEKREKREAEKKRKEAEKEAEKKREAKKKREAEKKRNKKSSNITKSSQIKEAPLKNSSQTKEAPLKKSTTAQEATTIEEL